MKPTVPLERARTLIQGWYNEFCKDHGKPTVMLDIQEEDDKAARAYKVTNTENKTSTIVFWSIVSDYESSGSSGIPGDLRSGVWDAFMDLG